MKEVEKVEPAAETPVTVEPVTTPAIGESAVNEPATVPQEQPPVVIVPPQSERGPITDLPPVNNEICPTNRHYTIHLDEDCNAGGRTIDNLKIVYGGNLANAVVPGTITSERGFVANTTIESTGILEGGYVTSFINNQGLMRNFELRGAKIRGGKLGGKIIIASLVINEIRDVTLEAGTVIQGRKGQSVQGAMIEEYITGKLAGRIQGDASDPALLENVTIADNAELENVILSEGVILGQNVTQKNVVMVCTPQRANGKGFNSGGFPFDDDQTCFAVQLGEIALTLDSASDLLGQTAEPLFVVIQGQKAFMFTNEWQDWDGELNTLQSGSSLNLKAVQTLVLPDRSQFTGDFKLYAGLRLIDGTVLYYQMR